MYLPVNEIMNSYKTINAGFLCPHVYVALDVCDYRDTNNDPLTLSATLRFAIQCNFIMLEPRQMRLRGKRHLTCYTPRK